MEKKIDVVYKLGIGSAFCDAELRYSLRSLKNFIPLGKVYVVGHKPNWVQNIIHIPAIDCYKNNKDANLINKLILATVDHNLSEEFLNISDDQLFLQPTSYEDLRIPYYDNKHATIIPNKRLNRWEIRLHKSIYELKEKGLKFDCFETHLPVILNKNNFASVVMQYAYGEDRGMVGNTLYFNTIHSERKQLDPSLIARPMGKDSKDFAELCKGKKYLSYAQSAECNELFDFLQTIFAEKSIYEK